MTDTRKKASMSQVLAALLKDRSWAQTTRYCSCLVSIMKYILPY